MPECPDSGAFPAQPGFVPDSGWYAELPPLRSECLWWRHWSAMHRQGPRQHGPAEQQPVLRRERMHQVERRPVGDIQERLAQRPTVNGDHVAEAFSSAGQHPGEDALDPSRIKCAEQVREGVVARDSVPQGHEIPQDPLLHAPVTLHAGAVLPSERKQSNAIMGISWRLCFVTLLRRGSVTPLKC